jgi:fatty acid desaturase
VVALSGLLLHAFMIVVVHDGAHRAITRTRFDSVLMNVGAGLVLLPPYGELFRRYHLLHHAHTNEPVDPLWPPFKKDLYRRHRRLCMLAELVPFAFTILVLLRGARTRPSLGGPRVRPAYVVMASLAAIVVAVAVRPRPGFVLLTVLCANAWGAVRHWCEHVGPVRSQPELPEAPRESNTYRFPLGMGIGNHAAHHAHPGYSWIAMAIGLAGRPRETGPLSTVWSMLVRPDYQPYALRSDEA